ncbi:SpaA isopeptide-forming pilin-related protein [Streptococcus cameli]
MKKIFALLTVIATVFGFYSTPVSAVSSADTATLTIENVTGNPTVTLYKIGEGEYSGSSFVKFKYADGINNGGDLTLTETGPTSQEINAIAAKLIAGTLNPLSKETMNIAGTTASKEVSGAGVYVAVLTGATDGSTYNPILLAASYNDKGVFKGGLVDATTNYLYGETSVAKKSTPSVTKEITAGTVKDEDKDTVGLGSKVDYSVTVALPSYPANALNKTVFVSDTMSEGLTFDFNSLVVEWNGEKIAVDATKTFTNKAGQIIGKAVEVGNGFNIAFIYDQLASQNPVVKYSGIVNDKAVVGQTGNTNNVQYIYANNPNKGKTYNDPNEKPDPQSDDSLTKKEDSKTVYTYQLSFKKVDSLTKKPLAGAVFGIYEDAEATKLIDTVTTNAQGYAISTKVGKGTYYIKEITAPTGYSLNTEIFTVTASWATATTTTSKSSSRSSYTSDPSKAVNNTQVGWLKNNVFYAMNIFNGDEEGVTKAYLVATTTTSDDTTVTTNNGEGSGTSHYGDINNTPLGELPSTGAMGTYLFTFLGVFGLATGLLLFIKKKKAV